MCTVAAYVPKYIGVAESGFGVHFMVLGWKTP